VGALWIVGPINRSPQRSPFAEEFPKTMIGLKVGRRWWRQPPPPGS